jgi:hypothetical protein
VSVANTSREAYASIVKINEKQSIVYEALRDLGIATNEMIADYLNWPINRVTGRVSELKKFGMVDVHGVGKSKAGRSSKLWMTVDINDKKLKDIAMECGD